MRRDHTASPWSPRFLLALLALAALLGALPAEASLPSVALPHQVAPLDVELAGDVAATLQALDVLELEAALARHEQAAALLARQLAPPDRFSLARPAQLARLGELLTPNSRSAEALALLEPAPAPSPSLSKTRVWASSQIWQLSRHCRELVSLEDAVGYELGLAGNCIGRTRPNLYAFVGWSPQSAVDPLGLCGPCGFVQKWTRFFRGDENVKTAVKAEAVDAARNVATAVVKEGAATAIEEMSPVGVLNGISGAAGYDFVRQERVEGGGPRFMSAVSALPFIPGLVKKAPVGGLANKADDIPSGLGGGGGGPPSFGGGSPTGPPSGVAEDGPFAFFNTRHVDSAPNPKGLGPHGARLQSHHALQQAWAEANLAQYGTSRKWLRP